MSVGLLKHRDNSGVSGYSLNHMAMTSWIRGDEMLTAACHTHELAPDGRTWLTPDAAVLVAPAAGRIHYRSAGSAPAPVDWFIVFNWRT